MDEENKVMKNNMKSDYNYEKASKDNELNSSMSIENSSSGDEFTRAMRTGGGKFND